MYFHLFRKEIYSKNKKIKKWYYWFYDKNGKQIQRVCKGCLTKAEAENFIAALPVPEKKSETKISEITREMYIPGSLHVLRREQMGKSVKLKTLTEWRRYINVINNNFGDINISDLTVKDFTTFLLNLSKSTSWKNHLINVMDEVYQEAVWQGIISSAPALQTFKPKYTKADTLTEDEIQRFVKRENFANETEYMIFLLTLSAGMRISEARAFRPCQLSETNNVVYVDGFLDKSTQERNDYCKAGSEENPKWRVAIIPDKTAAELREFISKKNLKQNDLLFTHSDGSAYRIENLEDIFERALISAGIEKNQRKLVCHSLRYTYVTRMRQIYDSDTVRKMAGHTNQKTNDYYNRPTLLESERSLLPVIDKAAGFFS